MNNRFTKEMKKQFQKIRFLKSLLDNSTDSIQIEVCFESIFIYFDGINETLKNCQSLSKEVKEELHNKFNSEFENQIKICKNIKNTYHNVVDQKYIDNWSLIRNPSGNFYALLNFKKGKECLAKQKELESLLIKLKDKLAGKMTHSDKDNAFFHLVTIPQKIMKL